MRVDAKQCPKCLKIGLEKTIDNTPQKIDIFYQCAYCGAQYYLEPRTSILKPRTNYQQGRTYVVWRGRRI